MPLEATFVKHSGTKIAGKRSSTHIAFLFEVFLDAVSHLLQRGVPGFRLLSQFSLQPLNVLQPHKSILRLSFTGAFDQPGNLWVLLIFVHVF